MTPVSVLDRIRVDGVTVYPGQTEPAAFFLAPLSVRERNAMTGQLADAGVVPQTDELRAVARIVIPSLFPDSADTLLALCDAMDAHDDTVTPDDPDGKAAHEQEGARLLRLYNTQIHNPLTRLECPAYATLQRLRREFVQQHAFLRVQYGLRGWERGPCEFATESRPAERGFRAGPVLAAAEVVDQLSEADFDLLEERARGLSEVSKADRGN